MTKYFHLLFNWIDFSVPLFRAVELWRYEQGGQRPLLPRAAKTQNIQITSGECPYLALILLVQRADNSMMLKGNMMDFQLYILTRKTQNT